MKSESAQPTPDYSIKSPRKGLKGGSHLRAPNYRRRYHSAARR